MLRKKRFPYQAPPEAVAAAASRGPTAGSLQAHDVIATARTRRRPVAVARRVPAERVERAARLRRASPTSGHPLMVAGPQVAYFNPQILMEEDVHAPGAPRPARGSTRRARRSSASTSTSSSAAGATTRGARRRPARTSSTRSRSPTCRDDRRTTASAASACRSRCSRRRTAGCRRPATRRRPGAQTLRAERTKLGPRRRPRHRARQAGAVHEAALDLLPRGRLAPPASWTSTRPRWSASPATFQRAASKIGYTFNWFYADAEHIAYFNSGANPVRAKGIDHDFPVAREVRVARLEPGHLAARRFTPLRRSTRRRSTSATWSTGTTSRRAASAASDENAYSSTYRSVLLEDRAEAAIARRAQADAAGADRRRWRWRARPTCARTSVLPLALEVVGRPRDPALRGAVDELRAWLRAGGLRRDANQRRRLRARRRDPDHGRLVAAVGAGEFQPVLGAAAFRRADRRPSTIDNAPNNGGEHLGSAYQDGWYGYVRKDLRTVLGRKVRGPYSRVYCGGGSLKRCRAALRTSLRAALAPSPATKLYGGDPKCREARRPVVLRRGPPPPGRRRHPAADPLDQPPDVPAGRTRSSRRCHARSASGSRLPQRDLHRAPRRRATRLTRSACWRSSSTRARGSSERCEVRLGELAVVLHGSPAQLDAAQPWLPGPAAADRARGAPLRGRLGARARAARARRRGCSRSARRTSRARWRC